jgi:hypothetical protein
MSKPKKPKPAAPPPEVVDVDETANDVEDDEPETAAAAEPERETITSYAVPPILDGPDQQEKAPLEAPITSIIVYRRQDPTGVFSWLSNVQPTDIPDEQALLAAFGVGVYKLVGKDAQNKVRRIRIVPVGDFAPRPVNQVATAPALPSSSSSGSGGMTAANVTAAVTAVLGFFSTLLDSQQKAQAAQLQMMQQNAQAQMQAMQANSDNTMKLITSLMSARTGDLEQLLKSALSAKGNNSNGSLPEITQDLLAMQQAMFENALEKAREAGDDGLEKLITAVATGWAQGQANKAAPSESNGAAG